MPKLEIQAVQSELEQGLFWPVYWLCGAEKWKARQLTGQINKAVRAAQPDVPFWGASTFDGESFDGTSLLDEAQSLTLGGGLRCLVVRDAHLIKDPDVLAALLSASPKAVPFKQLDWICIFLSKDLDGRKKFTKTLIDQAAVVPCEEVPELQREAWISRFAQDRKLTLSAEVRSLLVSLDPWTLELMEQELDKLVLAQSDEVLSGCVAGFSGAAVDQFIEHFLNRRTLKALPMVHLFADQPQLSLPLLGLLAWNVRNLAGYMHDQSKGLRNTKLNPYVLPRFQKCAPKWTLPEVLQLQEGLSDLDFQLKQTPLLPLGLWSSLVMGAARGNR